MTGEVLGVTIGAVEDALPMLDDGFAPMDLPHGATLQADGSVRVDFDDPVTVAYQTAAGRRDEMFDHLVLRRLTGRQVMKLLGAARSTSVALAEASGMTQAKLRLLTDRMFAPDLARVNQVIAEILGGLGADLPGHAEEIETAVVLKLRQAVTDGEGATHDALTFNRLRGGDIEAMAGAKDVLQTGIHRATGLTLKAVKDMMPEMDGADLMDAQRVIGFLAGNGRTAGR